MTQAFVYKWTHLPTLRWYVGSRSARGCHPDDGYICSSKTVKPLILANPEEWKREIIDIGNAMDMRELEAEILQIFDAAHDTMSFNKTNGDGKFNGYHCKGRKQSKEEIEKRRFSVVSGGKLKGNIPWNKGKKGLQSSWNKGKKGIIKLTEEQKLKRKGKIAWNKGLPKEEQPRFGKKLDYKKPHTNTPKFIKMIEGLKEMNKTKNSIVRVCPHCEQVGEGPAMIRWHFANCRQKGGK